MYIDVCTHGIDRITHGTRRIATPINLGSSVPMAGRWTLHNTL